MRGKGASCDMKHSVYYSLYTNAVVTIRELVAYIVKTDVPSSRETENRIAENVPYRLLTARNRSGDGFEH